MTEKLIHVRIRFKDVYDWGRGFRNEEALRRWNAYWNSLRFGRRAMFWRYCPPDEPYEGGYLAGTAGAFYVHPYDFQSVLRTSMNGLKSQLLELENICKGAAEAVGGTCEIVVSEVIDIRFNDTVELHKALEQGRKL